MSDGRVLPFADIRCDSIRRYLASGSVATMARAMARVTAHEMYHMMTGRAAHCDHGVAKAEFSLDNLTADRFVFSAGETEMLRATSALRPIRNSL